MVRVRVRVHNGNMFGVVTLHFLTTYMTFELPGKAGSKVTYAVKKVEQEMAWNKATYLPHWLNVLLLVHWDPLICSSTDMQQQLCE